MTKSNIFPEKIPNQFWERGHFGDIILYALGVYGPLKREEFINNKDKGIKNRMNKNTFHKWAKKLKNNNYINVSREKKYSIYTITNLGVNILVKRLKTYNLDVKTVLDLERKSIYEIITQAKKFFNKYEITNKDITMEFLKLKNGITRDKFRHFSEEKFDLSLLFLILNHPKYYDYLGCTNISIDNFIIRYSNSIISKDELKWFLQKINVKRINNISFYKLKLSNKGINLYFRSSEEYGRIFEITIQSILRDHYYYQNLSINNPQEIIISETCEEVLTILINKYNLFHKDLESSLYDTIKYYLLTLLKNRKKKSFITSHEIFEIPTIFMAFGIFDFERLDYFQKRALFHLEEAHSAQLPSEYRVNIKFANNYIIKAINFDKKSSYNYAIKAQIFHLMGDYNGALEAIYKSIKLDPQVANYYSDLAFFLSWHNKYEEALIAINKAIELDPYNAEHYSDLSTVYLSLNDHEKALEALNLAIDKNPQNFRYYIRKSNCLAYDLHKYNSALKVIEKLFHFDPKKIDNYELYKAKAGILLCKKNHEAALKIIRKARELYPNKEIYPNLH